MKKITLKPLDDGQKSVDIPVGKTTIGRGPFLGCCDKKVSRNHAILEVTEKGDVFLTPTHVNPCFFQPTSESPGTILKKDKPHKLENGDSFSLLPRAFRYKLLVTNDISDTTKPTEDKNRTDISEEKVNGTSEEKPEENSVPEPKVPDVESENEKVTDTTKLQNEKIEKESKETAPPSTPLPNNVASDKDENKQCDLKNGMKVSDPELNESDSQEPTKDTVLDEEETSIKKEEAVVKNEDQVKETDIVKKTEKDAEAEQEKADSDEKEEEKEADNETGVRTHRTLPEWLVDVTSSSEDKKAEKNTKIQRGKATTKRKTVAETAMPEKRSKKRVERRQGSDEEVTTVQHHQQRSSTGRSPRTNRQTRQGLSLEDFIASDDDEWQSDHSQRVHKKRRRARRRDDDSGSDWETEHKKTKRVSHKFSSGSESDWGSQKKKKTSRTKRRRSRRVKDPDIISDEEEEDNSTSEKPEKRIPCQYGKKCFRKAQSHTDQFSHPGDSDYESDAEVQKDEEAVSEHEENDERKECPYGTSCYRKNPQHRKEFKHTKKVRPQREAAKQAGKKTKVTKENDEPDSYDLNDSFINDDSDEYKPADSGSDFETSPEVQSGSPKGSKRVTKNKRAKRA